jgi:DNA-binding Lrp family transcriptional regulator/YHS domain-containing protein
MRDLDETDRELLRLLLEDGRAAYNELADAVGLSPPAVSDRIDRLRELGVIERFTVDVDRSRLREGTRLAVTLGVAPGETTTVREALADVTGVEHVFVTADGRLFVVGTFPDADVEATLSPAISTGAVERVDISPLAAADWYPALGDATLGLECVECGNSVTAEGVGTTIDGRHYEFCCESCQARFEDRYEAFSQGA